VKPIVVGVDRSALLRAVYARRKRAKTRAAATRAARLAHGAQEPRGPMLRYLRALLAWNAHNRAAVEAVFTKDVLAQISTHQDAVGPGFISRKIDELRVKLGTREPPREVIDQTAKDVSKSNGKEMKRLLGIDVTRRDMGLGPIIDKFREDNVSLISSIPDNLLDDVQAMLEENTGLRVESLAAKLQERFEVSDSKAALIARDQTLKLNGQITKTRQQTVGVTQYVWTTSNDERVREEHAALEGTTQDWSDPPVTNSYGDTNHPGEDYQCRCTAFPLLPEADEDVEI
jgi:SPP1 gp7 family putative phage head morphogenesis protein